MGQSIVFNPDGQIYKAVFVNIETKLQTMQYIEAWDILEAAAFMLDALEQKQEADFGQYELIGLTLMVEEED